MNHPHLSYPKAPTVFNLRRFPKKNADCLIRCVRTPLWHVWRWYWAAGSQLIWLRLPGRSTNEKRSLLLRKVTFWIFGVHWLTHFELSL